MNKIINISIFELKKIFIRPYIYIGIIFAFTFAFGMTYLVKSNPQTFHIKNVYAIFADIGELILFVFAAKSLSDDFMYKTTSIIFTKSITRSKIIIIKVLSLALLGFILGVCLTIVSSISGYILNVKINVEDIIKMIFIYTLYSFCIGTFALLTTVKFKSFVGSFISCIGAFWFLKTILIFLSEKNYIDEVVLKAIPFYTASNILHLYTFGFIEIGGLFLSAILFMLISIYLLKKTDIT